MQGKLWKILPLVLLVGLWPAVHGDDKRTSVKGQTATPAEALKVLKGFRAEGAARLVGQHVRRSEGSAHRLRPIWSPLSHHAGFIAAQGAYAPRSGNQCGETRSPARWGAWPSL